MDSTCNPTCLVTGKTDKLMMYPLRDKKDNMIGWIFLHESVDFGEVAAKVLWETPFKVKNTLPTLNLTP